jgi:hypothetical protein
VPARALGLDLESQSDTFQRALLQLIHNHLMSSAVTTLKVNGRSAIQGITFVSVSRYLESLEDNSSSGFAAGE